MVLDLCCHGLFSSAHFLAPLRCRDLCSSLATLSISIWSFNPIWITTGTNLCGSLRFSARSLEEFRTSYHRWPWLARSDLRISGHASRLLDLRITAVGLDEPSWSDGHRVSISGRRGKEQCQSSFRYLANGQYFLWKKISFFILCVSMTYTSMQSNCSHKSG